MKKFIISTAVFVVAIITMVATMCFIKPSPKFTFEAPTKVVAFAKSSVAIINGKGESEFTPNSQAYKDLTKEVDKMFKISMFKRVLNNDTINPVVNQDMSGASDSWSSSLLTKNYVVELLFDKKQHQVVYYQGDSRPVEYFGLRILCEKASSYTTVKIYFKTSTDGSYTNNPMVVSANTEGVVKTIEKLK